MNFSDIEIDETRYELRKGGKPVAVEPKVFDLISFFAKNPNRLISKDELIEEVWQGRIVSDAALASAVKVARRAIGDHDVKTSRIQTVRGRGFRMELGADSVSQETGHNKSVEMFAQPSFAVLIPENGGSEKIATMVQRQLSHAMSRVPFVTVAAPKILRQLDDQTAATVRNLLGPGFALDFTIEEDGQHTRLDCVLFETSTGNTVWSYLSDPFNGEKELEPALNEISIRLEPQLVRAIYGMLSGSGKSTGDPRAMTLQALGVMSLRGWNRGAFKDAEAQLKAALQKNQEMAFAHGALALIMALGPDVGLSLPSEKRRTEAIGHADKAIELDGHSSLVLGFAGCALCDAGQGLRGKTILERALSIDSGNPQALAALGTQLLREGELDRGIELMRVALRSAPRDNTRAVWRSILALALLKQGKFDDALSEALQAVEADDQTHLSRAVLACVHIARNELDKAQAVWTDALRVTPELKADELSGLLGRKMSAALSELG